MADEQSSAWAVEGTDLARGVSGGLLLGVPLVFTNEVWGLGRGASPGRALVVLAVTFVPLVVLNRTSGFRSTADIRTVDAAADAVEALAVGVVVTTVLLLTIGQATGQPLGAALATIAYTSSPVAIGVGLSRHLLRERSEEGDDSGDGGGGDGGGERLGRRRGDINGTVADLGATALGAAVIAMSIAPTEEVEQVAAAMSPGRLLTLVLVSLVASHIIVFVAGFSDQEHRRAHEGVLQRPHSETVAAYLVSVATAGLLLWFFDAVGGSTPPDHILTSAVALGLPASIGGAAGRLAT